tara:strand:- start:3003 stop:3164 length:162 start_codon:yes stop_codon:yes gene_type:complete
MIFIRSNKTKLTSALFQRYIKKALAKSSVGISTPHDKGGIVTSLFAGFLMPAV